MDRQDVEAAPPPRTLLADGRRACLSAKTVAVSAGLCLLVAVPTLVVEEDWNGRPMIEQASHLWILAALLVAAAFVAAGALAGFRRPEAAALNAIAAASVAVAALVAAALARRLWVAREGVPAAVVELWLFGSVTALVSSALGSRVGRRLARHRPEAGSDT